MVALDLGPYYADADYITKAELVNDYDYSKPKSKKSSDMHPYLMLEPTKVDFRKQVMN